MEIKLNRQSDQSLINQISTIIAEKIRSEYLQEGSQLPSIRSFSKENQVSPVTVSKAYALLERNGYIEVIHGKGAFVRKKGQRSTNESCSDYNWQLTIPDYIQRSQSMLNKRMDYAMKFSSATIHPGLLPSVYLVNEIVAILQADPQIVARYGTVQGDEEVRKAIQDYVQEYNHIATTPQEIIVTNGVQQGIDIVARTFIGPGDIVITEAPK